MLFSPMRVRGVWAKIQHWQRPACVCVSVCAIIIIPLFSFFSFVFFAYSPQERILFFFSCLNPLSTEKLSIPFFFLALLSSQVNSFVVFCARVSLTRPQHFAGPEANNLTWHRLPQKRKRTAPPPIKGPRPSFWRPLYLSFSLLSRILKKGPKLIMSRFILFFFSWLVDDGQLKPIS